MSDIETLAELDESYQKYEHKKVILYQLSNELGEELFNKAMDWRDVTPEDKRVSDLTVEERDAIKETNSALDKCYELHHEFLQEMKVHRFSLQEVLTLILFEMYPSLN